MKHLRVVFVFIALAIALVKAKPSHPFGFHGVADHLDFVPPILPAEHFHASDAWVPHHAKFLPPTHFHATAPAHFLHAPAPLLPAPAPVLPAHAHLLPAPAPLLPAPAPILPAPAAVIPAPAPLIPHSVVHTHTHIHPAPTAILPPVYEAVPFVAPSPSYRAIAGPKVTTHHVSLGYAFPQARLAKVHGHLHAEPLSFGHHHHHSLF